MESFKDIEIGGLLYKVGDLGSILTPSGRKLIPEISNRGYCLVKIQSVNKRFRVHRLVAKLHVPNPANKPQVNHKDCDKLNNRASDLEWTTDSENKFHAHRMGRYPNTKKYAA